jgi:NADH:ubiquinone oxidoreductase subunit 5 (subunit L)/multisubunit Na+/H+ antiporter MnhA subunit
MSCSRVWFILRWELIGILSLILISWYRRSESVVSGYTAFNYNRMRDIGLML